MNTSLTSITPEQKEQCVRVVSDAARKGSGMAIDELARTGLIDRAKLQRVTMLGNRLASAIINVTKEAIVEFANNLVGCLRRISGDKGVFIDATNGTETLASAEDVFSVISPDFTGFCCGTNEKPTARTRVDVFEMIENGTIEHIFNGFRKDFDHLCCTQSQVKWFTRNHRNWFCSEGHGTLFLVKVASEKQGELAEYSIVHVRVFSASYFVLALLRFSDGIPLRAQDGYRVVVPS